MEKVSCYIFRCLEENSCLGNSWILKGDFREGVTKASSINKIGHGLHELDPVYNEFTLKNDNLKQLARDLAYHKDPLGNLFAEIFAITIQYS
jgi:hypothetical protein